MKQPLRHVVGSLAALAASILALVGPARALDTPPTGANGPAAACHALRSADFTAIPDAPAQITEAVSVDAKDGDPAYCRVLGYVAPQVGFEMHLPLDHWNGKFMEVGDGGWGGEMYLFLCRGPLRRGYACIASDMGHKGKTDLALWAQNNLQAQVDFGYRATHVTALIGKALVRAYYGKDASKSIMYGCSTGGYQGMVEAQRFPWDFDGIVAIAPDMHDEADLSMRIVWKLRSLTDAQGLPIFAPADLQLLHRAALAKCDLTDGVKDGIVGDPVGCQFDPAVLACRAGESTDCLNRAQIDAAKRVYAGPTNSHGVPLSTRGEFPGSELDWTVSANSGDEVAEFFKYMLFNPSPGPSWRIQDFDFDRDYKRLGGAVLYSDGNPDLRKFKSSGAKLLVAQGGNDAAEIPGAIIDYYDTVERTMGGRSATEDFFRLFVVPGMKHCSGGDGAFAIDYLGYLETWVEEGRAPDRMISAHVDSQYLLEHSDLQEGSPEERIWWSAFKLVFPLAADIPVTFRRPVYPYPELAKYKGTGDPTDAAQFGPVDPAERRSR
jgi:hypothetical protein